MFDEKFIEGYLSEPADLTDWVLFKYRNNFRDNKYRDDGSLLCSARDWIHVAVRYINNNPLPRRDAESFDVLSYIMAVDNIVEAVNQMHLAIFPGKKPVFWDERDCFPDNFFQMNDFMYFKRLRACFGAHPVDIGDKKRGEDLRFASWSGDFESSGDFSVLLYSEIVGEETISLKIDFRQLHKFAKKYFSYLVELKSELERQYKEYIKSKRNIVFDCAGDPLTMLNILWRENKERMDNSYYESTIDQLKLIFETPISSEENAALVDRYKTALLASIEEIRSNVQNMNFDDLKSEALLTSAPKSMPAGWGYPVGKLVSSVFDQSGKTFLSNMNEREIRDLFEGRFAFDYSSLAELYVLVNSALYSMVQDEQSAKN